MLKPLSNNPFERSRLAKKYDDMIIDEYNRAIRKRATVPGGGESQVRVKSNLSTHTKSR